MSNTKKETKKAQAQKEQSLLSALTANTWEQITQALADIDRQTYKQSGTASNKAKNAIELYLYKKYIDMNETADSIQLKIEDIKTMRTLATICPYILGVKYFSLDFNNTEKTYFINFAMSKPYGTYKKALEDEGLHFSEPTKEEEEILNTEQQNAVNEANSILASYGLKYMSLNN